MTLIATVKAADANSYQTEASATSLLANRLNTGEWTAANTETRESALLWATSILENCMIWFGMKTTAQQRLAWPRSYVSKDEWQYWNPDAIPDLLMQAHAEFAYELLRRDRTKEPGITGKGLDRVKVGPIDITVSKTQAPSLIPPYIVTMLKRFGDVDVSSGRFGEVKLIRS